MAPSALARPHVRDVGRPPGLGSPSPRSRGEGRRSGQSLRFAQFDRHTHQYVAVERLP